MPKLAKNEDGSYVAHGGGILRPIIAESPTRQGAMLLYAEMQHLQEAEEYAMAAEHGALSDQLYGEQQ